MEHENKINSTLRVQSLHVSSKFSKGFSKSDYCVHTKKRRIIKNTLCRKIVNRADASPRLDPCADVAYAYAQVQQIYIAHNEDNYDAWSQNTCYLKTKDLSISGYPSTYMCNRIVRRQMISRMVRVIKLPA